MPVGANSPKEEADAPGGANPLLVAGALGFRVGGVAIKEVGLAGGDVDGIEKVAAHEGAVAFRVIVGEAGVFVHVEGDNVAKAKAFLAVKADQLAVGRQGRGAGRKPKDEGTSG